MREASLTSAKIPAIPWRPVAVVATSLAVAAGALLAAMATTDRAGLAAALPTVDALLNGTSAVLLVTARQAARRKSFAVHMRLMLAATLCSALFLSCYLLRFALTGAHRYALHDWTRPVYLAILGTHTLCAASVPFLAGTALVLAARRRFAAHRRVARVTFPIWLYVSVTGVIVYLMLYHLSGV